MLLAGSLADLLPPRAEREEGGLAATPEARARFERGAERPPRGIVR